VQIVEHHDDRLFGSDAFDDRARSADRVADRRPRRDPSFGGAQEDAQIRRQGPSARTRADAAREMLERRVALLAGSLQGCACRSGHGLGEGVER
jgi:hypothetical protein